MVRLERPQSPTLFTRLAFQSNQLGIIAVLAVHPGGAILDHFSVDLASIEEYPADQALVAVDGDYFDLAPVALSPSMLEAVSHYTELQRYACSARHRHQSKSIIVDNLAGSFFLSYFHFRHPPNKMLGDKLPSLMDDLG